MSCGIRWKTGKNKWPAGGWRGLIAPYLQGINRLLL